MSTILNARHRRHVERARKQGKADGPATIAKMHAVAAQSSWYEFGFARGEDGIPLHAVRYSDGRVTVHTETGEWLTNPAGFTFEAVQS